MPDLPDREHPLYCGIDPGHTGGIALMNRDGTTLKVWKMPWKDELDLDGLQEIFGCLRQLPDVAIGIEWPVAWPGSFANVTRDAENFGRQKGYLEAFAFLHGLTYFRISPLLWTKRLGLEGKTKSGEIERRAALVDTFYPEHKALIRGPRGGIHDGILDAVLICHFLRTSGSGMRTIAEKFGKDSVESLAFVLGAGRRKLKMRGLTRPKRGV